MRVFRHLIGTSILAIGVLTCAALGAEGSPLTLESPNGEVKLEFRLNKGAPEYSLAFAQKQILNWSALGLNIKDQKPLNADFLIQNTERNSLNETWEQVWGEQRLIRNEYNELKIELIEGSVEKRRMNLIFRAFNEGVAFRYELPEQPNLKEFVIWEENTQFRFAADHAAWWIPANVGTGYELLYTKSQLSKVPTVSTPLTIEGNGLYFSIHEAALVDYAAMNLKSNGTKNLVSTLVPWADGSKVKGSAPMKSPWRTFQIGRTPGDLVTSYMVLNLNEPNKLADTSWIKPKKFIGIWWGMHIGRWTWNSGPDHGATTERTRQYIDYAADLKIPAVLVEGWNLGWDGDWFRNGDYFSFTQPYPDFDIRALSEYARSRGVELVGHHETAGGISNYERQMDDAYRFYRDLGIHTVKTGYVGERLEGEWHDGQFMVRHYQLSVEKAARNHMMLDVHEPVKDTGLRRTYPNLMTREGGRGTEYDAWSGHNGNPPDHTTVLPFTRGLSGPFDFTPGIFDLLSGRTPGVDRVRTTLAKQLALYVTIYSPLQMAADLPENYKGHPAFKFIQDVPTDWEETRVLNGKIGDYVTIARKDRNSEDWYLGSVTDENSRELSVKLDFLTPGRTYCAEIYRDRSDTHWSHNPMTYEITSRSVSGNEVFSMSLAPGGGQAVRFISNSGTNSGCRNR